MKKITGAIVLVSFLWTACQQQPRSGYIISGKIKGLDSGEVYLMHRTTDSLFRDTAQIKNGTFTFSGHADEPSMYILAIENDPQQLDFFVENASIIINASVDSLNKAKITGSKTQDQYEEYKAAMKPYEDAYDSLYAAYENAVRDSTIKQIGDSLNAVEDHIDSTQNQAIVSFIKSHPQSVVGAWAVTRSSMIYNPDPALLETIYNSLDTSVQHSSYGKDIDTTLMVAKTVAVGKVAPDFTEMDTSGHPFTLSSLHGKYVLVDFWASWCGPCRRENPNVVKAYNQYKNKGFTVLGVSLDENKNDWLKAIHADKLYWNQVSDLQYWHSKEAKLYGIKAIPSNFLLDTSGVIIARNLRGDDLDKKLAAVLK